jgi:hypothetical protein
VMAVGLFMRVRTTFGCGSCNEMFFGVRLKAKPSGRFV